MKLNTKQLNVKKDERGWLAEIVNSEDVPEKFGLVLITTARANQTKGNHYHLRKKEWYCVIRGTGLLKVWSRNNQESTAVEMSAEKLMLVEIPIGYFHSITNIGNDEMYLLAYVSEPFDPRDPDTYYE